MLLLTKHILNVPEQNKTAESNRVVVDGSWDKWLMWQAASFHTGALLDENWMFLMCPI